MRGQQACTSMSSLTEVQRLHTCLPSSSFYHSSLRFIMAARRNRKECPCSREGMYNIRSAHSESSCRTSRSKMVTKLAQPPSIWQPILQRQNTTKVCALDFDLDVPEIDCSLRSVQEDQGAIFQVIVQDKSKRLRLHACPISEGVPTSSRTPVHR